MNDRALARLFRRYRERHDLAALGRVFDATSRELLELAAHLVRDPQAAEDVLQQTFLAALEHAERWDPERGLTPWLVGILTREARLANRNAARRPEPEDLQRPQPPGPDQGLLADELRSELRAALDGLPPLYREVLVPYLAEGRGANAIARELERAPGTVRVQIHRGLELLRRALPAGLGLGALAGLSRQVSARGLAAVRDAVLRQAAAGLPATAAVGGGVVVGTLAGGLLVKKLALVALTLVLAVAAWRVATDGEPVSPEPGVEAAATLAAVGEEPAPPAPAVDEPLTREVVEAPAVVEAEIEAPEPTTGSLLVRLLWEAGGEPAVGVGLDLSSYADDDWEVRIGDRATDSAGEVLLGEVPAGQVLVRTDRARSEEYAQVEAGEQTVVELTLPGAIAVHGTVVDERGEPLAGAAVWLSPPANFMAGRVATTTDEHGRFELRGVSHECYLGARAQGLAASELISLRDPQQGTGSELEVQLELAARGARVTGRVLDGEGLPCEGAWVTLGGHQRGAGDTLRSFSVPMRNAPDGSVRLPAPSMRTRSDERGSFELEGVEVGTVPATVWTRDHAIWAGEVGVEAVGATVLEFRLQRGAVVEGVVLTPDGGPATGIDVHAVSGHPRLSVRGKTDSAGAFRLEHVIPGRVEMIANDDRRQEWHRASELLEIADGARVVWNATLPAALAIEGRAFDERGEPLALAYVCANAARGMRGDQFARTDERGGFRLEGLEDVLYRVEILDPEREWGALPLSWVEGVSPGTRDLVLALDPAQRPSAWIEGRVVDARRAPVESYRLSLYVTGREVACEISAGDGGRFRLGPLPAGEHAIGGTGKGFPSSRLATPTLAVGQTLDLGELVLEDPGALQVLVALRDGGTPPDFEARLQGAGRSPALERDGARLSSGPLPAGDYELTIEAPGCAPYRKDVRIVSGRTTEFEAYLEKTR